MAFNYNHVMLVGRLTKDAELHPSKDVCRLAFSLAVDRAYRKEDGSSDTDFIPIVAWGKLAEIGAQYLKKGQPVLIDGRLQVRSYEKDGDKKWSSEVIVENFQLLGKYNNIKSQEEVKKSKK
tara:strand:- start:28 stop:393 length:366 start_codon:yes stop_codon:yes gene_type:complete